MTQLPRYFNQLSYNDIGFALTEKYINKKITVNTNKDFIINDELLDLFFNVIDDQVQSENNAFFDKLKILNVSKDNYFKNSTHLIGTQNQNSLSRIFFKRIKNSEKFMSDYFFKCGKLRNKINDYVSDSVYNHHNIRTGRYTIQSGVNYLTMSHEEKIKLKPLDRSKYLVEVDIKSCEPGILYHIMFNSSYDDLYTDIIDALGVSLDRKSAKLAIISTLYGASLSTTKKLTGLSSDKIKKLRDYFNIETLNKELQKEFEQKGFIFNMYGRPIVHKGNFLNYWLQSTAADFASMFFINVAAKNKDAKLRAIIHDAAIFEVCDKDLEYFRSLKATDSITNIELPINFNVLFKPDE